MQFEHKIVFEDETHTSITIPEKLGSNIKDLDAWTVHLYHKTTPFVLGILGSAIVFSSALYLKRTLKN